MYKKILTIIFAAFALQADAQNYNPFVVQGQVSPAPMPASEQNGTAQLSFLVGNSGDDMLPLVTNQEMILIITLSRGIPDNANPIDALGGTFKSYFNWSYDVPTHTYSGIQNQNLPAALSGGVGNITIAYAATSNSSSGSPQNGFNVNLTPPPYTNGINSVNDDQLSSYTFTNTPLPVWWKSFDVSEADCSVRLDWVTYKEQNISHFEIQRKGSASSDFQTIYTVKAAGNSDIENSYVYFDRNLVNGNYQYRIKSVDIDKQFVYSTIENAQLKCGEDELMYIFPNPAKEDVSLVIRTLLQDNFIITLSDITGKIIYESNQELNSEVKTFILPVNSLPNGLYNLSVKNTYDTRYFKIQKQR